MSPLVVLLPVRAVSRCPAVTLVDVPEFLRWGRSGGPFGLGGRNSPSGLARGFPWLWGRSLGPVLSVAAGLACFWSTCLGSCFLRSRAKPNFLLGTRFLIFARDEFLSGVLLIFGGCGRSYPVMVCHPSPGRVALGGRSLGGFAGLADLRQVASHGSVGYSEYLCYFWHSVAELDHQFDGLSSAGVVVVGIVGVPASVDACGLDVTECSFAELAQAVPGTGLGDGTALGVGQRGARRILGCSAAGRGRATGRCVLMEDGSRPVRSVGEFHAEAEQIYNGAFVSVP